MALGTAAYAVAALAVQGADVRVRVHKEKVGLGHGDVVHLQPDGNEAVVMRTRDGAVIASPARLEESLA